MTIPKIDKYKLQDLIGYALGMQNKDSVFASRSLKARLDLVDTFSWSLNQVQEQEELAEHTGWDSSKIESEVDLVALGQALEHTCRTIGIRLHVDPETCVDINKAYDMPPGC